jgi:hypothetical protein
MKPGTFKFWCPSCGQHIAVTLADVGTHADCPACGKALVVPDPEDVEAPCPAPQPAIRPRPKPVMQRPPLSRRLAPALALLTAALLAAVAVVAYIRSGATIGKTEFHRINPDSMLYIAVLDSGRILANGRDSSLHEVQELLAKTKRENGAVRFYQEHRPNKKPPLVASEVLLLITDMDVPIDQSTPKQDMQKFFNPQEGLP